MARDLGCALAQVIIAASSHYCASAEVTACESPIEQDMVVAFQGMPSVEVVLGMTLNKLNEKARSDDMLGMIIVAPQVKVGKYRADFILAKRMASGETKLVNVECDGHAYHRATMEQISKDARRDMLFAELGIHVMRFSGKRIFRDQFRCAREAVSVFSDSRHTQSDE